MTIGGGGSSAFGSGREDKSIGALNSASGEAVGFGGIDGTGGVDFAAIPTCTGAGVLGLSEAAGVTDGAIVGLAGAACCTGTDGLGLSARVAGSDAAGAGFAMAAGFTGAAASFGAGVIGFAPG